jgi:Na+-transporting NADH:ubiquinone oxidoreductase subunit NqrF
MKVGFTGTQEGMTEKQKQYFDALISKADIKEFHHGDCIGADTDAHNIISKRKEIQIHIHPPDNDSKRAYNESDYVYEHKPYLERNHDIVDAVDVMIATPKTEQEELRSGTWATIRYARKAGKKLIIISPKGGIWKNPI